MITCALIALGVIALVLVCG